MSPEQVASLRKLAEKKAWDDDPEGIGDYLSSNQDDAYYGGVGDGKIQMARELLDELGIEYKKQPPIPGAA